MSESAMSLTHHANSVCSMQCRRLLLSEFVSLTCLYMMSVCSTYLNHRHYENVEHRKRETTWSWKARDRHLLRRYQSKLNISFYTIASFSLQQAHCWHRILQPESFLSGVKKMRGETTTVSDKKWRDGRNAGRVEDGEGLPSVLETQ